MTTTSTTAYDPGTVVWAYINYTDAAGVKLRPAVIVSCVRYHASKADAVIVPLTSQKRTAYFGDYDLLDWSTAGLNKSCRAKGVISTIERSAIERRTGRLSKRDLDGIKAQIRLILEL